MASAALLLLAGCTLEVNGDPSGPGQTGPLGQARAAGSGQPGGCPGGAVEHQAPNPSSAVLPTSVTGAPPVHAESGHLQLGRVTSDLYYNEPAAEAVFRNSGYVIGFRGSWGVGPRQQPDRRRERSTVLEFTDAAGACRFAGWERSTYGLTPRSVTDVPGAVGYDVPPDGDFPGGVELLATKGEFVILVVVVDRDADQREQVAQAILRSQYERA